MNNDDIKKIVSETISNPDILDFIAKQIQDQIEKEQSKLEQDKISNKKTEAKIDNHTKNKINDIKSKADNYTSNNEYVNKYISERDKFMGVFEKITKDKIKEDVRFVVGTETDYCEQCECVNECKKESDDNKNISYTSSTSGWKQTINEDGKPVGYLYFNFDSNNKDFDIHKQLLDLYSILTLHTEEWDNWDLFHYDYTKKNFYLSVLIDDYTYHFNAKEAKIVDSDEDDITSFIYTKPDDNLKMFSIYILNYSTKTNKLYDFIRIIITLPDELTEMDYENYYINLEKYFSDKQRLINLIEDYTYTFINRFKVNNHIPVKTDEDMYVILIGDIIRQIQDKINSQPISGPTKIEFKKEDTPDKTNSILDKLGIPHDEKGNVEIPISSDFISNRISGMNKHSDINIIEEEPDNPFDGYYYFIKGKDNQDIKQFLINVINDGFIKVDVFSPEHIHLNINGTNVFLKNPYASNPNRDIWGNKKH